MKKQSQTSKTFQRISQNPYIFSRHNTSDFTNPTILTLKTTSGISIFCLFQTSRDTLGFLLKNMCSICVGKEVWEKIGRILFNGGNDR